MNLDTKDMQLFENEAASTLEYCSFFRKTLQNIYLEFRCVGS